ncbi:MAG: PIG-L deacetylase family protein [Aquisalimonadaceae bacterium]
MMALGRHGFSGLRALLCIGAHSDDIEIGCGGTLLRLLREFPGATVHYVVLGSDPERASETRAAAGRLLRGAAEFRIDVRDFRNGYFPWVGSRIKDYFETLKGEIRPDLILTHFRDDRHQDHRLVSDLTWSTFRDHLVLEYEIPKYDGDIGRPNLFVPLTSADVADKLAMLMECFPSQHRRSWFSEDTFLALMRLRGIESNAPEGYAEAFHCRKLVI